MKYILIQLLETVLKPLMNYFTPLLSFEKLNFKSHKARYAFQNKKIDTQTNLIRGFKTVHQQKWQTDSQINGFGTHYRIDFDE
jgi:hypothetical protein